MRAFIFGFLLFCCWSVFSRYYYVCLIKNNCEEVEIVEEPPLAPRLKNLAFVDGDSMILKDYEQFAFAEGKVEAQLSDNNKVFLEKLSAYLIKSPKKTITLTGRYSQNEKGLRAGFYEDLGTARAAAIRSLLIARGIDENRIYLDFAEGEGERITEPILFGSTSAKQPEDYENGERLVKASFSFKNMTYSDANFEYDSDIFRPGESFKLYADSVLTYINMNEGKVLTIIGHTDNHGSDQYNEDLGLRRAASARKYFLDKGLEAEIRVGSKGKREPIAPNTTPENKQKNRRVNLILN